MLYEVIKKTLHGYKNISVRKLISILLTITFCYLSVTSKIDSQQFVPIFSIIVGYYFGKSTALDVPGKHIQNEEK